MITPTRRAAQVAAAELRTPTHSAAWLAHQHGFRWDTHGRWTRQSVDPAQLAPEARLQAGDVLLVDEAGMLDQDTARALLTIADENAVNLALVGDRHQLPAVGRGGVLDLATRHAHPAALLTLDAVHRFTDPAYADLTLLMRTGRHPEQVFDALHARGHIVIHPSESERRHALATAATAVDCDPATMLVLAPTREQVATLNAAIRDARHRQGGLPPGCVLTTHAGEELTAGDVIATRRNDPDLDVANRDRWTITHTHPDGCLTIRTTTGGKDSDRVLPAHYVRDHVELAHATTVHGSQGETVDAAHFLLAEGTGAAATYVAMTRGRHRNTAHLVAHSVNDARDRWVATFARDHADLGPTHAAYLARRDIETYGPTARRQHDPPTRDARHPRRCP